MNPIDELSKIISTMRKKTSMTQEAFGEKLGISKTSIHAYEAAKSLPRLEHLERIASERGQLPEEFLAELYGRSIVTTQKMDPLEELIQRDEEDRLQAIVILAQSLQKK